MNLGLLTYPFWYRSLESISNHKKLVTISLIRVRMESLIGCAFGLDRLGASPIELANG